MFTFLVRPFSFQTNTTFIFRFSPEPCGTGRQNGAISITQNTILTSEMRGVLFKFPGPGGLDPGYDSGCLTTGPITVPGLFSIEISWETLQLASQRFCFYRPKFNQLIPPNHSVLIGYQNQNKTKATSDSLRGFSITKCKVHHTPANPGELWAGLPIMLGNHCKSLGIPGLRTAPGAHIVPNRRKSP